MSEPTQTDQRLMRREGFARVYAVLLLIMVAAVLYRVLPPNIDFANAAQVGFVSAIVGVVIGWITAPANFFFFIQATEKNQRDQRQGDGAPLVGMPSPTKDQTLTVEVRENASTAGPNP